MSAPYYSRRASRIVGRTTSGIENHARFGRWTVLRAMPATEESVAKVEARCDCGTVRLVRQDHLRAGRSQSCGCLSRELSAQRGIVHGAAKRGALSAEYRVWAGIKARCTIASAAGFASYGGRGIKVCDRWRDFSNFVADMGPRPSARHSIDRINPHGNYEPGNCRWATTHEQARNRTDNAYYTVNGVTQCLTDWAAALGLTVSGLHSRIRRGWTPEQAMSTRRVRAKAARGQQ